MPNSPLSGVSFWALDEDAQKAIRAYVDPEGARPKLDVHEIYLQRMVLALSVEDAEEHLARINVAAFPFLSSQQKQALEGELFLVFYQLSAQYKLDATEREWDLLPDRGEKIKHCANLINRLRLSKTKTEQTELECALSVSEKHTKYLGLRLITPDILENINAIHSGRIRSARAWMTFVNERRLYWVWGGGMIATLLSALPKSLADISAASTVLGTISPITGSMSWMLYFARAGIVWSGLLAHTFDAFMGQEERDLNIPWYKRFQTQWNIHKYALLNDSIWGICNMACFFILVGSGMAGYWGNVLTALLLLMDVSLTVWHMAEEEADYRVNKARYQNDIRELEKKIKSATLAGDEASIATLREALRKVKRAEFHAKLNWKYKQLNTGVDLVYAVSLLSAFCILCCFFFPPAAIVPATGLVFALVGISMCFTFNLIYMSTGMALNMAKSKEIKKVHEKEFKDTLTHFIALVRDYEATPDDDDVLHVKHRAFLACQLKQHYLTLKELRAETNYQRQTINHQRYQLIVSTLRDALIPVLFIASLVFMPLGLGIPVLVAGVALAIGAYIFLEKIKPQQPGLPGFDMHDYQQCHRLALHSPSKLAAFFDKPGKPASSGTFFTTSVKKERSADKKERSAENMRQTARDPVAPHHAASMFRALPQSLPFDEDDDLSPSSSLLGGSH